MARLCSVCTRSDSARIGAQLAAGVAIATIAQETSISESSLRRHMGNHLGGVREVTRDTTSIVDLIDRLQASLDDVDRVRASALSTGRGDLVVKSAQAGARLIEILTTRLGIDDLETAQAIRDGLNLAQAVARATRRDPAIGHAIAREMADISSSDFPAALEALATSVDHKQIQK